MKLKYIALTDKLYRYIREQRSDSADPLLKALQEETDALGDISRMQISPEQGTFLGILVAALGVKSAIEVGTFTGYSSLCIARGLPADGHLLCLDASKEWTAVARRYWKKAGVDERIELQLGSAIPLLKSLKAGLTFDFAFIDAAKSEYAEYYELLLPRIRQHGLLVFDNMLWGGRLGGSGPIKDSDGAALDALNKKLASDPRVESVLLPVADGLQLCRKR
jgi:caffeoyl-CoA O-methyltransferase